jgi:hypothetical protein
LTLCILGHPDHGLQWNAEALARARTVAHPFTSVWMLLFAAYVHYVRKDVQRGREQTEAVMALATEYGFIDCLHQGMLLHGWACVLQDQRQDGLAEIHQGLDGYRASGQAVDRPRCLALLAEACAWQGQVEAGLAALAEALSMVGAMPGYAYQAVLYQLQGELLQRVLPDRLGVTQTPEACFQQALAIARRQQARAWELRAAIPTCRRPTPYWRICGNKPGWKGCTGAAWGLVAASAIGSSWMPSATSLPGATMNVSRLNRPRNSPSPCPPDPCKPLQSRLAQLPAPVQKRLAQHF